MDLNEYYCVSNLPGLLRSRGGPGDEEAAAFLDRLTVLATQRKIDRGEDDGWARSTLLGAAFRVGDGTKVAMLTKEVAREGPAAWQLDSTLKDINDTIDAMPESETKQELAKTRDRACQIDQVIPNLRDFATKLTVIPAKAGLQEGEPWAGYRLAPV